MPRKTSKLPASAGWKVGVIKGGMEQIYLVGAKDRESVERIVRLALRLRAETEVRVVNRMALEELTGNKLKQGEVKPFGRSHPVQEWSTQSSLLDQLSEIQAEIEEHLEGKRQDWLRLAREWLPTKERNGLLKALTSDDPYLRDLLDRKYNLKKMLRT